MAQMQEPQREQPPREAAGRSYVPWSSSRVYLHALHDLKESKQPVNATVVNWLPNIATSFQRVGMHPSAHLNLSHVFRVF